MIPGCKYSSQNISYPCHFFSLSLFSNWKCKAQIPGEDGFLKAPNSLYFGPSVMQLGVRRGTRRIATRRDLIQKAELADFGGKVQTRGSRSGTSKWLNITVRPCNLARPYLTVNPWLEPSHGCLYSPSRAWRSLQAALIGCCPSWGQKNHDSSCLMPPALTQVPPTAYVWMGIWQVESPCGLRT